MISIVILILSSQNHKGLVGFLHHLISVVCYYAKPSVVTKIAVTLKYICKKVFLKEVTEQ